MKYKIVPFWIGMYEQQHNYSSKLVDHPYFHLVHGCRNNILQQGTTKLTWFIFFFWCCEAAFMSNTLQTFVIFETSFAYFERLNSSSKNFALFWLLPAMPESYSTFFFAIIQRNYMLKFQLWKWSKRELLFQLQC